jgi:glutathione S-transferase
MFKKSSLRQLTCIDDLRTIARRRVPRTFFEYADHGSYAQSTPWASATTGVLRRLNRSGLLAEYPNLSAYVARGEARPAFRRAFDAQLAVATAASA